MMKRLIPLLLLASCTLHQGERLQEVLLSPKQASVLRNEHLVREVLFHSSSSSALAVEKIDSLALPLVSNAYALQGVGLPVEERMLLASYDPLRDKITVHLEFELQKDNMLQIFGTDEIVRETPLVLKNILQGQEVELALFSKEMRTCSKLRFIPHPISLEENGALYTLQTTHRKGTHFLLYGEGLAPNESLTIREQSETEIRTHQIQADAEGRFTQHIEPIVLGRLGGHASIDISRDGLPPSRLDYAWGGKLEAITSKNSLFCPLVFAVNRSPEEIDTLALATQLQKKLTLL